MKRLNGFIIFTLILAVFSNQPKRIVDAAPIESRMQGDAVDPIEYQVFVPILFNNASNEPSPEVQIENLLNTQINGNPSEVVGAIVEGLFISPVVQQTANEMGWVSDAYNTLTSLQTARQTGDIGLAAVQQQLGEKFFAFDLGQTILILMGDGAFLIFQVDSAIQFQTIDPENPSSDLINLNTNEVYTINALEQYLYNGSNRLVFQTNIIRDGIDQWGRLIVIATPVTD